MKCRAGDWLSKAHTFAAAENAHNAPAGFVSARTAAAAETASAKINSALLHRVLRIGFPLRRQLRNSRRPAG